MGIHCVTFIMCNNRFFIGKAIVLWERAMPIAFIIYEWIFLQGISIITYLFGFCTCFRKYIRVILIISTSVLIIITNYILGNIVH